MPSIGSTDAETAAVSVAETPRPTRSSLPARGPQDEQLARRERGQSWLRRYGKRVLGYAVLVLFALVYLGPFLIQLVTSFKTDPDATNHPLSLLPNPFTLAAWKTIFGLADTGVEVPFWRWLGNSVLVTVCITIGRVFLDSLAGYALARLDFPGRRAVFTGVIAVLAVPGVVILVPKFLVLNQLGLFDNYGGMILPLVADAAGIFLMKQFFEAIPREMEEAAHIDGAGTFRTYWSVVLPLARPGLITLTILSFQGSWNEFTHFLVATSSPRYETLTLGLARFQGSLGSGNQFPITMGAALLATIPVAIVFFVFQRRFVQGQVSAGVKG